MPSTDWFAGYLLWAGKPYYALALLALIAPQVFFQVHLFLKTVDSAEW